MTSLSSEVIVDVLFAMLLFIGPMSSKFDPHLKRGTLLLATDTKIKEILR